MRANDSCASTGCCPCLASVLPRAHYGDTAIDKLRPALCFLSYQTHYFHRSRHAKPSHTRLLRVWQRPLQCLTRRSFRPSHSSPSGQNSRGENPHSISFLDLLSSQRPINPRYRVFPCRFKMSSYKSALACYRPIRRMQNLLARCSQLSLRTQKVACRLSSRRRLGDKTISFSYCAGERPRFRIVVRVPAPEF